MTLTVERQTREPEAIPDVWLAFAPVKRTQTDWLVEKATELGVARLMPVMTQRTIAERVKLERLRSASRSRRPSNAGGRACPTSTSRVPLKQLLGIAIRRARSISPTRAAASRPIERVQARARRLILIGPEGGFTDEERDGDPRGAERHRDLARPAHPARRNRRAGRAGGLHGVAGDWRPLWRIKRKCWRALRRG